MVTKKQETSSFFFFYTLIAGQYPWLLQNDKIYSQIKAGKVHYDNNLFSKGAQAIISGMLCVDTASRLTAAEVHNHPWTHGQENAEAPLTAIDMMKALAEEYKSKNSGSDLIKGSSGMENSKTRKTTQKSNVSKTSNFNSKNSKFQRK